MCNTKKTVCMIFIHINKDRWITDNLPAFTMLGCKLTFVSEFIYLYNNYMMIMIFIEKLKTFFYALIC